jgi:hypothetical protein
MEHCAYQQPFHHAQQQQVPQKSAARREHSNPIDKADITGPVGFTHAMHVGYDSATGEFRGLPKVWATMLSVSLRYLCLVVHGCTPHCMLMHC